MKSLLGIMLRANKKRMNINTLALWTLGSGTIFDLCESYYVNR